MIASQPNLLGLENNVLLSQMLNFSLPFTSVNASSRDHDPSIKPLRMSTNGYSLAPIETINQVTIDMISKALSENSNVHRQYTENRS